MPLTFGAIPLESLAPGLVYQRALLDFNHRKTLSPQAAKTYYMVRSVGEPQWDWRDNFPLRMRTIDVPITRDRFIRQKDGSFLREEIAKPQTLFFNAKYREDRWYNVISDSAILEALAQPVSDVFKPRLFQHPDAEAG